MKTRVFWLLVCPAAAVLLLLTLGLFKTSQHGSTFRLQAPPFMSAAWAQETPAPSVIEKEAGLCAYCSAGAPIKLSAARNAFRTIETETPEYILGSVPVPGYGNNWDAHAYVSRDGWILVYYLKDMPAAGTIDWNTYTGKGIGTKLENALANLAAAAGAAYYGPTYYDFRYPNATHMMIIADTGSFDVKLTSSFGYSELSCSGHYTRVDGKEMTGLYGYAFLTTAQLRPDVYHTISAYYSDESVALVLIYRVPQ